MARDQESRAWGYAMYGSVYGFAGVVGPLLGGLLASPATLYPSVFSPDGIFATYPYLLVTLLGTILSFLSFFLTWIFLEEHDKDPYLQLGEEEDEVEVLIIQAPASHHLQDTSLQHRRTSLNLVPQHDLDALFPTSLLPTPSQQNTEFLLTTWNTLGPIYLYCTVAFVNTTYNTCLPLFFSASPTKGGLGLDSRATGTYFSSIALSKLIVQFFLFAFMLRRFGGAKQTYQRAMFMYIPSNLMVPMLMFFSGNGQTGVALIVMAFLGACESLAYLSVMLLITESQYPLNLGKAHGLAATLAAFSRTISPAVSGLIWQWGEALHWNWLVFVFNAMISLFGAVSST
jgi:MFS family permease